MTITFESIPLHGINPSDLAQLLYYIEYRERDMWYYGNKEQFEKRHEKLKDLIGWAVEYAYSDGVKLPKAIKRNANGNNSDETHNSVDN